MRYEAGHELGTRVAAVFDLIGPLYRKAYRTVEPRVTERGISVGERAILVMLHRHGPMTVPHIARAQALTRQFVQRTVNDAAARNLVRFAPNPAHRKSSLIELTDDGRLIMERIHDDEHGRFARAAEGIDDDDLEACLRVLERLLAFLGEQPTERVGDKQVDNGAEGSSPESSPSGRR